MPNLFRHPTRKVRHYTSMLQANRRPCTSECPVGRLNKFGIIAFLSLSNTFNRKSEIKNKTYAAFEIYFTKLLLATGSKVCSSGKAISLCT